MEKRKTIFDYLTQVFVVFGFTILTLNVLCLVFGNGAKSFSSIFELGNRGVPVKIVFQFLCISVLIIGARFVFFTDVLIKKMPIWLRTVCMLTTIVIIIAVFVLTFHWFPANMWKPWAMFFLSFGISFLGSCLIMIIREKVENKRMDEALRRLKEQEGELK